MKSYPQFKSDREKTKRRTGDSRTEALIINEYLLERRLSDQLRNARPEDRGAVYSYVYKEFYESISQGPNDESRAHKDQLRLKALYKFLSPQTAFVEVGAGNGNFAKLVAPFVKIAYAVDVQDISVDLSSTPENFVFLKESGSLIPLSDGSVDLIFSDQFMEHLHPEDAIYQLSELVRVLRPRGRYYCITPSRATGPHDSSGYFDDIPMGFHLKEYDYRSIESAFKAGGFKRVQFLASGGGVTFPIPFVVGKLIDSMLLSLPQRIRRVLRHSRIVRGLAGLTVVGIK